MAYGITSSSQLIDVATIYSGCDKIDEAAKYYTKCSEKLNAASTTCNKDAMSIDGKTMQPTIDGHADSIKGLTATITSFTAQIRSLASQILVNQQNELAAYQESLKKKS